MPKVGLRESFEMQTRDRYTKVECEIGITVDGRELPSAAVLGAALEEAIEMVQARVKESYEVVPPRAVGVPAVGVPAPEQTPVAETPAVPAPAQTPAQPEPVVTQATQVIPPVPAVPTVPTT